MKDFNFASYSKIISVILIGIIIVIFLINPINKNTESIYSRNSFALNTAINITIYDNIPENDANIILDECMSLIDSYEKIFSKSIDSSDISRINNACLSKVEVSPETINLLSLALDFASLSDGLVDPTIGSLSFLWDITGQGNEPPSDDEISKALNSVDYRNIVIEGNTVQKKNADIKIDLGFIAKGYIADKLKEYLQSEGISSAIINLGGNIACIGTRADGLEFNIGVTDPNNTTSYLTSVKINNKTVVSSGNYERYFEYNGQKYHHILSTITGYPVDSGLSQVTIICDNSAIADALSTLCFILGYDEATSFLSKYYPDVQAIFVDNKGNIL